MTLCRTWVHQFLAHVIEAVDLLLLWRVDHHGGGAEHAEQAAQLPVQVQPLRQEVGREHSAVTTTRHALVTQCTD